VNPIPAGRQSAEGTAQAVTSTLCGTATRPVNPTTTATKTKETHHRFDIAPLSFLALSRQSTAQPPSLPSTTFKGVARREALTERRHILKNKELEPISFSSIPFCARVDIADRSGYRMSSNDRWRISMETVKISPKYQVVIPKRLREALELAPGQKMQMIAYADRIEMIPVKRISDMRGFLKGIDTTVKRESDRV